MENIDVMYVVLGTIAVAMTALIASKRLSKRQRQKNSKNDPWGGIGKGVRASDYFYTEE
tara:strand:- start:1054 stop:1230 length:177 start_codon:yes stop_codon:yes gene_type:complete